MLFLQELVKFKTAFGKLWLAGVKPNSVKKKPFNKELIENADIQDLVSAIFNIDVPLSPRLSGTFLCGVCAIYDQKLHYFELDVMALFRRIHFTKRLKSSEDDEPPTRKRKKRSKAQKTSKTESKEKTDLNAILNDLELDLTQINLDHLQQQEQEETDELEALVRSQLYQTLDEVPREKRPRCEAPSEACLTSSQIPNISNEIYGRETSPFIDEDNYLMMNEDELFNEMHGIFREKDETSSSESGQMHHESPSLQETTPPPLSYQQSEIRSGDFSVEPLHPQTDARVASPVDSPLATPHKAKVRRRREQCESVVVDKDTFLPEEMLRDWRLDTSAITTNARMTRQQLEDFYHAGYSMPIGSRRLRRLMECRLSASRFKRDSEQAARPSIDRDIDLELGSDTHPGFQQIERLRGIDYEENQIEEETNLDTVFGRRESLPSIGAGISPQSALDEVSGTRTERSSLADPFQGRVSLSSEASRRESLNSNRHEILLTNWFDPTELTAAVSPSTAGALANPRELLFVEPNLTTALEIESTLNTNTDEGKPNQVQKNYTIESWRFIKFIEKCLEKEKSRHVEDGCSPSMKPCLSFSSIVVPGTVSALIAARSFYQLLVLASTGDIEVNQTEMGGGILISQGELVLSNSSSSISSKIGNGTSVSVSLPESIECQN